MGLIKPIAGFLFYLLLQFQEVRKKYVRKSRSPTVSGVVRERRRETKMERRHLGTSVCVLYLFIVLVYLTEPAFLDASNRFMNRPTPESWILLKAENRTWDCYNQTRKGNWLCSFGKRTTSEIQVSPAEYPIFDCIS